MSRTEAVNIRLKTIGVYAMVSMLIGILVVFLILLFASMVNGQAFNFDDVRNLYSNYNVLYLINLIPVFFLISGGAYGDTRYKNKKKTESALNKHTQTIDRVIEYSNEIGNGNLSTTFSAKAGEIELEDSLEAMRKIQS